MQVARLGDGRGGCHGGGSGKDGRDDDGGFHFGGLTGLVD